jgi:Flp pilus assembly protein TadD
MGWNGECFSGSEVPTTMRMVAKIRNCQRTRPAAPGGSFRFTVRTVAILIAATALMLALKIGVSGAADEEQTCSVSADSALGLENYPAAITLHRSFLLSHPDDALAHYHLGFAYGMVGRGSEEIREYRKAVTLGLRAWDLFLDLGLAYLEQRDYMKSIDALQTSVTLGREHPEAHFNLAIAYENAGRLNDAMRETISALRMAPADPDLRNTKAIICAEMGNLTCARDEWTLLLKIAPGYAPARTNLAILMGSAPDLHRSSPNAVEIPQLTAVESWPSHQPNAMPTETAAVRARPGVR